MICHECGTKIPVGGGKNAYCIGDFEVSIVVLHKTCHLTKHCSNMSPALIEQNPGRKCCCGLIRWHRRTESGSVVSAYDYQKLNKLDKFPSHQHMFQYLLDYGTKITDAINIDGNPLGEPEWVMVGQDFKRDKIKNLEARRQRHESIKAALFTGLEAYCHHEPGVDYPMTEENQISVDEFPTIELSRRDAIELAKTIENPPEPSQEAIEAARRYKDVYAKADKTLEGADRDQGGDGQAEVP